MKKILYTINYLHKGGPTRVMLNIINKLERKKYEPIVLTIIDKDDVDIVNELKQKGIKVIQLKYKKKFADIVKLREKAIAMIVEENPDIVHANGLVMSIITASKRIKSKKIVTVHNNMYEDYIDLYGNLKGKIAIKMHQIALKKFDCVVCCSASSYKSLEGKLENLCFIRNGIDPVKYEVEHDIRRELNIPQDAVVYIFCGSMNTRKRILELTKMFSESLNNNEYFLVVGARGTLLEEVKKYNSENIRVLGFKSNVMDYYKASDIYVSYSSSEGFSISVIEALSAGLYLLLSDIPSHRECFEIDNDMYLGEIFDSYNFEQKKNLVKKNNKRKDKKQIIDFQTKYLSSKSMTNQYEDKYEELFL